MGKTAFLFSGQGAQYVGMGKQIASLYKSADEIYNQASEALNLDIKKMVFEGDEETLKITEYTQPAIVTTSVACLQPLIENGITPDYTAGLSLGEYSAHVASGTIDFMTAVSLVRKRGRFIQEAVPVGKGSMAAIIGLAPEVVIKCCKEASNHGIVEPANFNCPGQISISGEVEAVERAIELCNENGAKRAIMLAVSAPFHCCMLRKAGEKMAGALKDIVFSEFKVPLVANANAKVIESVSDIKELLIRQITDPVLWEASIREMMKGGTDTFVEIGPGKVLCGFLKKIDKGLKVYNVEDADSLKKTITELG